MRVTTRTFGVALAVGAMLALTACGSDDSGSEGGGGGNDVEVFTWWAEGSEKAGLDALVKVFDSQHPDEKFVNGAVAGGAGSDAKNVLASRLQTNDPPDTFQAHAGAELTDYINNGQIEDLSSMYEDEGWNDVFPQALLDRLTVDGKIYSVPSNIHRANVVWANTSVLKDAGLDPTATYSSMDDWFTALDKVKAAGKIPLSIATDWTQVNLLETVLIADLGVDGYNGLWDGSTDWSGPEMTGALEDYAKLFSYTNNDRQSLDWPDATQMVIDGDAAFNVMGDWAVAAFDEQDMKLDEDYVAFPVPGNDGVFDFLADSFVLPVGAPNPDGTKAWLETVASAEGQEAFNAAKGSIPANTEADTSSFGPYQQTAITDYAQDDIVSSIAHGAAAPIAWLTDITSAIAKFGANQDVAELQDGLAEAADKNATS